MNHINEELFDEVIYDNEEKALVFFHKKRCVACNGVLPIIKSLEEQFNGEISFYSVDVEENDIFQRFGFLGVPQVALFKEGKLIKSIGGRNTEETYRGEIEKL